MVRTPWKSALAGLTTLKAPIVPSDPDRPPSHGGGRIAARWRERRREGGARRQSASVVRHRVVSWLGRARGRGCYGWEVEAGAAPGLWIGRLRRRRSCGHRSPASRRTVRPPPRGPAAVRTRDDQLLPRIPADFCPCPGIVNAGGRDNEYQRHDASVVTERPLALIRIGRGREDAVLLGDRTSNSTRTRVPCRSCRWLENRDRCRGASG
jgi:hypothetical protein